MALILCELSLSWRVGPILDDAPLVDLGVLKDDGRGDNETDDLESGHLEKLVVCFGVSADLFVVLVEKEFADEVACVFVEFGLGTLELFEGLLDLFIREDSSLAFLVLALLNLFLVLVLVCAQGLARFLKLFIGFSIGFLNFILISLMDVLDVEHVGVVLELLVRALCSDSSLVHDHNSVGQVDEVDSVSNQDSGRILQDALEDVLEDLLPGVRVQSGDRIIHEDDVWALVHGSCETHSCLLAA